MMATKSRANSRDRHLPFRIIHSITARVRAVLHGTKKPRQRFASGAGGVVAGVMLWLPALP